MNNFLKNLLIIFMSASLYACGFQVIYRDKVENSNSSYVDELAAIRIKKDRTRLSQELKNNLYDLLNPDYIKSEAKYFLTLNVSEQNSPTFITLTGASGRNRVTISVTYQLENLETGEKISEGTTSAYDNYDVTDNRYGSYVASEYTKSNLTKIVAQNLRNSLVNDFIEMEKKIAEEKHETEERRRKRSALEIN